MKRLGGAALLLCGVSGYVGPDPELARTYTSTSSERAVILTNDNFDALTWDKLVFLKFFSPNCAHCASIKESWNELGSYYHPGLADGDLGDYITKQKNLLIGSIDCDANINLCRRFHIIGLPTILHGDASLGGIYLEEYRGDKTFAELSTFAEQELKPLCNPGRLNVCDSNTRKDMEMYMTMSYDELNTKINGMENAQTEKIQTFTSEFDEMKRDYDKKVAEKETAKLNSQTNIRLINEIKKTIEKQKDEKEKALRKMSQLEKIKKMAAGMIKDKA